MALLPYLYARVAIICDIDPVALECVPFIVYYNMESLILENKPLISGLVFGEDWVKML